MDQVQQAGERYYRVEATWHDGEIPCGFGYTMLGTSVETMTVWAKKRAGVRPNLEVTVRESDYVHAERPLSHFEPAGYEGLLTAQQKREVHAWAAFQMLRAVFFPIWREWRLFITACGLRALNPTDPRVPDIVRERHALMERAS